MTRGTNALFKHVMEKINKVYIYIMQAYVSFMCSDVFICLNMLIR